MIEWWGPILALATVLHLIVRRLWVLEEIDEAQRQAEIEMAKAARPPMPPGPPTRSAMRCSYCGVKLTDAARCTDGCGAAQ